jgi:beta-fructofuranosidase
MLDLPDQWVWDFWVIRAQGTFRAFFLKAPRALEDPERRHRHASVGHAVSADLTNWSFLPDAVVPQSPPAFDDLAVWTGSVVADPAGGWRMFTTGISVADHGLVQRIGASWSPDLITWQRQPGPILEADERWYATQGTGQRETHWRDPWVFQAGGIWHLVATAKSVTTGTAVVAHAVSSDLVGWEIRPPLSLPSRRFAQAEVITVMPVLGRWALTFSCMADEMPHDPPGAGGVWSMRVPESAFTTLDGRSEPILDLDDAIRLTSEQLYVGRPVPIGDHEARFLAFRHHDESGRFVGGVIDPLELEWLADGTGLRLVTADWRPGVDAASPWAEHST